MERFVVISGCSGGGKSTLLDELARRGHAAVAEPGRRIVRQELAGDGAALPWVDMAAFARRAVDMALADRAAAQTAAQTATSPAGDRVFFDRGLIDAAVALQHATGEPAVERLGRAHRYHRRVFLAPPWPAIFVGDPERRHGLDDAVGEFERLAAAYRALGYRVVMLPRETVVARADFVLEVLAEGRP